MFADIADQAVPCNNNSSSGCAALLQEVASMLEARRKRERDVEMGKKEEARVRESPKEPTTSWWCIQRHCCFSLSLSL